MSRPTFQTQLPCLNEDLMITPWGVQRHPDMIRDRSPLVVAIHLRMMTPIGSEVEIIIIRDFIENPNLFLIPRRSLDAILLVLIRDHSDMLGTNIWESSIWFGPTLSSAIGPADQRGIGKVLSRERDGEWDRSRDSWSEIVL